MPYSNHLLQNYSGGEVSPKMLGRSDLPVYNTVLEWLENFIITPQGPFYFRPGSQYVHHTRLNQEAVFIPFQFNDDQSYLIEATNQKFRFYRDTGIITENAVAITGISNTSPAVVTAPAHGYSDGDEVFIYDVVGLVGLNGRSIIVSGATTNTFQCKDEFGNNVSAISLGAYVSGGSAYRIYEISTPYVLADLANLNYTQNADTMYITHRGYAPRKLVRTAETNWGLNTYSRTADPFGSATHWPGAVTFTSDGRLLFGGTTANPETLWFSRGPQSNGNSRFDDFTTGTSADNAVIITLAPIHGKVDSIRWLTNTDKFIIVGTYGGLRRVYGATEQAPVTPTSVNARSADYYGVARTLPVSLGSICMYVSRNGNGIRSIEYDYTIDGYRAVDKNLISDHILQSQVNQIVNQLGNPEILWAVRDDGVLVGLTYNDKEGKYGWHRHSISNGTVERLGVLPRENQRDQLWMIVKRTINGNTVRHIEYLSDVPIFPARLSFRTNKTTEKTDEARYQNALFEKQKDAVHVDAAVLYDGSALGLSATAAVTPGTGANINATTGVAFTSNNPVFTASMVGRQIWKKYDSTGNGGGRATITAYVSSTHVTCDILSPFDNLSVISAGNWFLTATSVSGIHHLEGETVTIVNDGALHADGVIVNGSVTLTKPASKITIGLPYTGLCVTMPIDQGGQTGPAVTKIKKVFKLAVRLLNTVGISFGTDPYNVDKIDFRTTGQITGRPIPLFSGVKTQTYEDTHSTDKRAVIVQDTPFPCTVLSTETYADTVDR